MPNDLNPDFQDLIESLISNGVDFLLVEAHALAFHGVARYTEDLDVWIRRSQENVANLRAAMSDFGVPISRDAAQGLLEGRKMLRFGNAPRRIEILNFLDGCRFEEARVRAVVQDVGGVKVNILSLPDYVATKRASGRAKDVSDLVLLRDAIGPLPGDQPTRDEA